MGQLPPLPSLAILQPLQQLRNLPARNPQVPLPARVRWIGRRQPLNDGQARYAPSAPPSTCAYDFVYWPTDRSRCQPAFSKTEPNQYALALAAGPVGQP